MFNRSLKKEAIKIHNETAERYNTAYEKMRLSCDNLYNTRKLAIKTVKNIEEVINSIARTPKEFDTKLGEIKKQITVFQTTESVAEEAYHAEMKAGVGVLGGMAAGVGVATMAPTALMGIATTFGTASTGTAISALSGAAAQKAAVAWIGRTFASFAVEGAGLAAGNAFLALAGPIGWSITALSTGVSLISLSKKNREISDAAIEEATEMSKAREALDEITVKIDTLIEKTVTMRQAMDNQKERIKRYANKDYSTLEEDDKLFLGALVNNTLSLSKLLNETVE